MTHLLSLNEKSSIAADTATELDVDTRPFETASDETIAQRALSNEDPAALYAALLAGRAINVPVNGLESKNAISLHREVPDPLGIPLAREEAKKLSEGLCDACGRLGRSAVSRASVGNRTRRRVQQLHALRSCAIEAGQLGIVGFGKGLS